MGTARTLWLTIFSGLALAIATTSVAQDAAKAKKKAAPNPAFAPVTDVAGLPRVLIIGDSISIGYTLDVREMLAGKANVHRIPTNGGPTTNGLKNIDAWLGDKPWDVIHFNWGLHDLKYITPDNPAALADPKLPNSRQQVPLDEYEQNLAKLVERMKATQATLIWCNTTPVPEGSAGRIAGDEQKYNAAAAKVMTAAGVQTNDLCAYAQPKLAEIQLPKNVHFTPAGSKVLAEKVAAEITAALEQRAKAAK